MKGVIAAAVVALSLMGACNSQSGDIALTESEEALFSNAGIDLETARAIRGLGVAVEQLQGLDDDWEQIDANGILLETRTNQGEAVLRRLRDVLDKARYSAYLHDQGFGFGPDSIAVLADPDPWEYLKILKINGINYDVEHEDVIRRLRDWDSLYGLNIVGAGMDWLFAEFDNPPNDWAAFAEEVYEFCPDVVDQGAGSIEALASELKGMGGVYLWWD